MGIHKIFINTHFTAIIIGLTIHFIINSNTILMIYEMNSAMTTNA
jgi:hypothetical protein